MCSLFSICKDIFHVINFNPEADFGRNDYIEVREHRLSYWTRSWNLTQININLSTKILNEQGFRPQTESEYRHAASRNV